METTTICPACRKKFEIRYSCSTFMNCPHCGARMEVFYTLITVIKPEVYKANGIPDFTKNCTSTLQFWPWLLMLN